MILAMLVAVLVLAISIVVTAIVDPLVGVVNGLLLVQPSGSATHRVPSCPVINRRR
jgi:hypothetical protein